MVTNGLNAVTDGSARSLLTQAYRQSVAGSVDQAEMLLKRAVVMDRHHELQLWEIEVVRCLISLQKRDSELARQHCLAACENPSGRKMLATALADHHERLPAGVDKLLGKLVGKKASRGVNLSLLLLAAIVLIVVAGAVGVGYMANRVFFPDADSAHPGMASTTTRSNATDASTSVSTLSNNGRLDLASLEPLIARVIVRVRVASATDQSNDMLAIGTGTAFVVGKDGLLLTNRHVVEIGREVVDAYEDAVDWDVVVALGDTGQIVPAKVIHSSVYLDVAVLKIDHQFANALRFAPHYAQGDDVTTLGYPGVASQIVSALNPAETKQRLAHIREEFASGQIPTVQDVVGKNIGASSFRGTIGSIRKTETGLIVQTDSHVYPGMSGGPLLTEDGRVIGIVTAKHADVEGINVVIAWQAIHDDLGSLGGLTWPASR